jgi:nucleoid-associated protein YgaU
MSNPGDALSAASALASQVPAYIQLLGPPFGQVDFQYNPHELALTSHAQWQATGQPGGTGGTGTTQYVGTRARSLSVQILLDTFSVPPNPPQPAIELLKMTLSPGPFPIPGQGPQPPTVLFGWGPNIVMEKAVVTSLSVTYKRFLLGVPVRAEVTVALQEVPEPIPGTNPTSGGLATRKTHTIIEGDTLASIANREYADPTKWRALAVANDIDDPMRLTPGTVLIVPDPSEAEALA